MTARNRIRAILDHEDCWEHVAMGYIAGQRRGGLYPFRKDGRPDRRSNVGRIVVALNESIGGAMEVNRPESWEAW